MVVVVHTTAVVVELVVVVVVVVWVFHCIYHLPVLLIVGRYYLLAAYRWRGWL